MEEFMRDILLWCTVYDNQCYMVRKEEDIDYPEQCDYCSSLKCETEKKVYYKKIKEIGEEI